MKLKKLTALLLGVTMTVTMLAGCGGATKTDDSSSSSTTETTTESSDTAEIPQQKRRKLLIQKTKFQISPCSLPCRVLKLMMIMKLPR